MKDIPVFATENGAAALSLQQIPYSGIAHITIHSTEAFPMFLQECVGFCRAVGAETILACGHNALAPYPVYTQILSMQRQLTGDVAGACLFPVTESSLEEWMRIYNDAMKGVPNAAILSKKAANDLLARKAAYYVHENGNLLGIGAVEDDTVLAIVSCVKGAGERIMMTLCSAVNGDTVRVEVAENNIPAMRLYARMGFVPTSILKIWYDVTNNICDVK